ncbi:hypothetical protein TRIUR3_29717 [Triticum urartu]|uniref:Uncharacterized protein n=1 Tax=Triticum urartu TaxID=4572 RepID=M7ZWZ0_TRIUA|nr:hypothetical protein TRIUR3_29717 [Triticum urartu]
MADAPNPAAPPPPTTTSSAPSARSNPSPRTSRRRSSVTYIRRRGLVDVRYRPKLEASSVAALAAVTQQEATIVENEALLAKAKKAEKCDAATFALQETLQGMMTKRKQGRRSADKRTSSK